MKYEPYTLGSVHQDLEDIKNRIGEIEKQPRFELYTVSKPQEAEELFERLTKMVQSGTGVELIVRRLGLCLSLNMTGWMIS
jgi:sugar-specific transcriptional regulator TrmB